VSAVGAKNPLPIETRLVHAPPRTSAEARRAQERPEFAVHIDASADRERQPASHVDIVLQECGWNVVLVGKARFIARIEHRTFERHATDPRLTRRRATHGEFGEDRILNVALANVTAEIIFVFTGRSRANRLDNMVLLRTRTRRKTSSRGLCEERLPDVQNVRGASDRGCT
jgi:hypothetical protein